MSREYYEQLAKEAGLTILYSDLVDKLCQKLTDKDKDFGDETIVCDRDEGYISCVINILGVAARFPGRKTWVFGFSECGYYLLHIFAEDSIRKVTKRLRNGKRKK